MKKPIYYTIVGKTNSRIMAVTTEKPTQLYGWWVYGQESTHVARREAWGRFATVVQAESVVKQVSQVWQRLRLERKPLDEALASMESAANAKVNRIIFQATELKVI